MIDNHLTILSGQVRFAFEVEFLVFFNPTVSSNNTFKTMFLCILNPSCPFSCSAVDPFWHFSGGIHEASCHWQTGTLQLQTKLKEGCFHSSLYLRVYRRSFGMSPFKVTGCSQPVILIILYICPCTDYLHILILTNIVIDAPLKELESKRSCVFSTWEWHLKKHRSLLLCIYTAGNHVLLRWLMVKLIITFLQR